jgi:hypothetical protein
VQGEDGSLHTHNEQQHRSDHGGGDGVARGQLGDLGDAAGAELDRPHLEREPGDAEEQRDATAEGVAQVDARAAQRYGGAAVCDQRVGHKCEQLEEDQEGQQVSGHRDAHGRGHAQAEETEEAATVRRVFEVADRVDRRRQPQHR